MDPVDMIAQALALGAAAGAQSTAKQVVKDGYSGLKALITRKYALPNLDLLENDPESPARQAVVAEDLKKANVETDSEIQQMAKDLLLAIKAHSPDIPEAMGVVIDVDEQIGRITIKKVVVREGVGTDVKVPSLDELTIEEVIVDSREEGDQPPKEAE